MNRRGFLQSCLALAVAPAIVRADSLMRVIPTDTAILTGEEVLDWYYSIVCSATAGRVYLNTYGESVAELSGGEWVRMPRAAFGS